MTSNYYYLVAGLPDLFLDEGKQAIPCVEFIQEASTLLSGDDFRLFNLLRLPFDNINLLTVLEKRNLPFDHRGSMSEEELSEGLRGPDSLPGYMQQFLEAYRENKPPVAGLTAADLLTWFFYEAMTSTPSEFIREWYAFDLHLRNFVAAINCRQGLEHLEHLATDHDKAVASVIIGRDDAAESILKSSSPDFGLSTVFPWADRVLTMSRQPATEFEKGLDTLRWDMVSEMTTASYFRAETVFAFFIKLTIVERWQALDPEEGRGRLDRLIEELKSSYTVPSDF